MNRIQRIKESPSGFVCRNQSKLQKQLNFQPILQLLNQTQTCNPSYDGQPAKA